MPALASLPLPRMPRLVDVARDGAAAAPEGPGGAVEVEVAETASPPNTGAGRMADPDILRLCVVVVIDVILEPGRRLPLVLSGDVLDI